MPHESTVGHEDQLPHNDLLLSRSRSGTNEMSPTVTLKRHPLERGETITRRFANTPRQITQVQDSDDSDGSKDSDKEVKPMSSTKEEEDE